MAHNLNLISMYRISSSISGKPFLPTSFRFQIHSEIAPIIYSANSKIWNNEICPIAYGRFAA